LVVVGQHTFFMRMPAHANTFDQSFLAAHLIGSKPAAHPFRHSIHYRDQPHGGFWKAAGTTVRLPLAFAVFLDLPSPSHVYRLLPTFIHPVPPFRTATQQQCLQASPVANPCPWSCVPDQGRCMDDVKLHVSCCASPNQSALNNQSLRLIV
jgi:hypothetical protein